MGLEHQVELTWLSELATAVGALFGSYDCRVELVGAKAGLALLAVNKGIHKSCDVA